MRSAGAARVFVKNFLSEIISDAAAWLKAINDSAVRGKKLRKVVLSG
jgi:hypothetical protein